MNLFTHNEHVLIILCYVTIGAGKISESSKDHVSHNEGIKFKEEYVFRLLTLQSIQLQEITFQL